MVFSIGDCVTRKSYGHDLLFRIASLSATEAILHGEEVRLEADAPLEDLQIVEERDLKRRKHALQKKEESSYKLFRQDYKLMKEKRDYANATGYEHNTPSFQLPVKVLHVDGDPEYLKKCLALYKRLGLKAYGIHMQEKEMPEQVAAQLRQIRPDCLVITGHDSYSKNKGSKHDARAYRHSRYFVRTVREAREIEPDLDKLIIFAGACQSNFESLIGAGANFASSPYRVNIHALDPVYIMAKVACTSFMERVKVWDVLRNTLTGEKGMGGVETKGLLRTGLPYIPPAYSENE
ncbi:sporulation peptidase YabG [Aciduricibacillus chroicocephali]|uniref:Sporulation peptidase YabG n=1 Tax=Aciduricibacillus chroicocephali TaxID=3054939 RepID=A0ABY9KV98_9BACI|nr:sporulation peptidase YabG [Bacillaceae bacterium 44XB]